MNNEKDQLIENLRTERFFLLDKTYQFLNYGLVTFGLGLNAIFAIDSAETKKYMAIALMVLFIGATISGIMGWTSYKRIRKVELEKLKDQAFLSPSYEYIFGGGVIFGLLATGIFLFLSELV